MNDTPNNAPKLCLLTGNSNPELAKGIAKCLGMSLGAAAVGRFSDGEVSVEINENIRGKDVFLLQSNCKHPNYYLMELLLLADAARRASATRVTAVMPYFGYARQDRRPRSQRVPISARVVADAMVHAGVDRMLTVDLHADQIQGFFSIPVDNVYSTRILVEHLKKEETDIGAPVIVSPDIGGVLRARAFAKSLDQSALAIVDKRRPSPNRSEVMNIIGDIKGKVCILVDDMVDTAGTLCGAANALKREGALRVFAYVVHPVLSGRALDNIIASELDHLVVSDTIALDEKVRNCPKIKQITLAPLLAEAIRRVAHEESIIALF